MKKSDWESMPIDELWAFHERISQLLTKRILAEKLELEKRLDRLSHGLERTLDRNASPQDRPRRKYPKVYPKYRNPVAPFETWSGRGKQPRWLVSALKSGGKIKDFETRDRQPG